MTDYENLISKAGEIQGEQTTGGNTALRIGSLIGEVITGLKDVDENLTSKTSLLQEGSDLAHVVRGQLPDTAFTIASGPDLGALIITANGQEIQADSRFGVIRPVRIPEGVNRIIYLGSSPAGAIPTRFLAFHNSSGFVISSAYTAEAAVSTAPQTASFIPGHVTKYVAEVPQGAVFVSAAGDCTSGLVLAAKYSAKHPIEDLKTMINPKLGFDEIFSALGGTVVTPGVTYRLNGVELTFPEAVEILSLKSLSDTRSFGSLNIGWEQLSVKTIFPVASTSQDNPSNWDRAFYKCPNLERLAIDGKRYLVSPYRTFYQCKKLKSISGIMDFSLVAGTIAMETFCECESLEEVRIVSLSSSINFMWCPKLSLASLQTLVSMAVNTGPITILVHPDTFVKVLGNLNHPATADMTVEELNEWKAIAVEASNKNINIAA